MASERDKKREPQHEPREPLPRKDLLDLSEHQATQLEEDAIKGGVSSRDPGPRGSFTPEESI